MAEAPPLLELLLPMLSLPALGNYAGCLLAHGWKHGFVDRVPLHRFANLGYWVRSSAAGRGVAPAAVRLLADWAFRETDLLRLEIVAAVGNRRSQRVAEKAGAIREGVLRDRLLLHGQPHDVVIYAILRLR